MKILATPHALTDTIFCICYMYYMTTASHLFKSKYWNNLINVNEMNLQTKDTTKSFSFDKDGNNDWFWRYILFQINISTKGVLFSDFRITFVDNFSIVIYLLITKTIWVHEQNSFWLLWQELSQEEFSFMLLASVQ